jgi:HEAT repeat protein
MELLRTADEELVVAAASALATLADPRPLEALLPLFAAAGASVRHEAIAAVIAINAPGTEALILPRLADADRHVRECAVHVMASARFDASATSILNALDDDHEDVRRAAIEGLSSIDETLAIARLRAALRDETSRNRAAAAHVLRSVHAGVEDALVAALDDPDSWVRYFAADSLAAHGGAAAVAKLTPLVARDPGTHVRIASLRTIAVLDPAAAREVAAAYVDAADDDLASAALAVVSGVPENAAGERP